ncbi:MAG TPA: class I SAM-dependent methyltransferase [Acidimicrobiia bacterium]
MGELPFYGPDQAAIHDERFGDLARDAARLVLDGLARAGLHDGTIVDLGCGSGILARAVGDAGYAVRGVDISPAMVDLARQRAPEADLRVGSLHDVEIPPCVAVTAIGEALNYATDARAGLDALARLAERVRGALAPGGLFAFDVAMPGRHGVDPVREVFHDHDTWALRMRAEEHADDVSLERRITIFKDTRGDGCYRRSDELHVLRLYRRDDVVRALGAAGFDVEVRDRYASASPSTPPSGWAVFVASA